MALRMSVQGISCFIVRKRGFMPRNSYFTTLLCSDPRVYLARCVMSAVRSRIGGGSLCCDQFGGGDCFDLHDNKASCIVASHSNFLGLFPACGGRLGTCYQGRQLSFGRSNNIQTVAQLARCVSSLVRKGWCRDAWSWVCDDLFPPVITFQRIYATASNCKRRFRVQVSKYDEGKRILPYLCGSGNSFWDRTNENRRPRYQMLRENFNDCCLWNSNL